MPGIGPIDINRALQMIVIILISIDIHELAHAIVADRLGDPTPRRNGQISLNPLVHMDQVGIMLLLLTSIASYGFTYGRTFVTPSNLKFGPQRGNAIVAIAGPLSNLAVAAVLGLILTLDAKSVITLSNDVFNFIGLALFLNSILFVINLIPIPPLDGFSVLGGFLTARQMYSLAPLQQWGPLVILLIFLLNPGQFQQNVILPAVTQVVNVVCGQCSVG